MPRTVQITLRANRVLGESPDPSSPEALITLTPLGLVVSEHVDKLGFFEPAVAICDKTIEPDHVHFTLRFLSDDHKPLEEIVRGFRIGCFRIAREYRLISPEDEQPLFAEGFEARDVVG